MKMQNLSKRWRAIVVLLAMLCASELSSGALLPRLFETWRDIASTSVESINDLSNDLLTASVGEQLGKLPLSAEAVDSVAAPDDPDAKRGVAEIIRSRGFEAEEHDVVTRDGYILTVQRIVNPLVKPQDRKRLYPVIMQHGLMSSSVDWVINSVNVKPEQWPKANAQTEPIVDDTQERPNSLGFYLANRGYDVFLANSRGNVYGQRHKHLNKWEPKFWDFTFDEQIKYDLPDTIEMVQKLTGHKKLGYVGHSQGTAMMFGLLADEPEYADIVQPYVALAPVAYVNNCISPVKYFAIYTPVFEHINMWFATSNVAVKYLAPLVCGPRMVRRDVCANIMFLSTGFDLDELDDSRIKAYLAHMPSGTSVKNIAHYGQEVISGRFAHFDHGILGNQIRYNRTRAPDYDLSKIRSNAIALFIAQNDWLASPKDVARLRAALTVEPYSVVNMTEYAAKWNHIDFVYGKHVGQWVNPKIHAIMEHFRDSH